MDPCELSPQVFADLLDQAKAGHGAALDRLVRLVDRRLLGFLVGRRVPDPEATTNEVLLRVCRSIDRFDGTEGQFRAWVFTIARNRVIDEFRASDRRIDEVSVPDGALHALVGSTELDSRLDQRQRVDAMLDSLTDEQREVVLLRVLAGLSVDETATAVGRRPGAVRGLQHRAIQHLRTQLSTVPDHDTTTLGSERP